MYLYGYTNIIMNNNPVVLYLKAQLVFDSMIVKYVIVILTNDRHIMHLCPIFVHMINIILCILLSRIYYKIY